MIAAIETVYGLSFALFGFVILIGIVAGIAGALTVLFWLGRER